MAIKQIRTRHWEGLSGDDKPTGVITRTTFRETDTRANWITYDDGTTWEEADKRVRIVNEDGSFVDLPGEFDALVAALAAGFDVAALEATLAVVDAIVDAIKVKTDGLEYNLQALAHHEDSRGRVYPQVAGATITLISAGGADTFGSWTEIVPIDIIDFEYKVLGLSIYGVDVAENYFIQLGFSIVEGDDPTTAQILGEREMRITATPIAKATELLDFYCSPCPANAKLWGRLKTASGATDEAYIAIVVSRHIPLVGELANLATWPWST